MWETLRLPAPWDVYNFDEGDGGCSSLCSSVHHPECLPYSQSLTILEVSTGVVIQIHNNVPNMILSSDYDDINLILCSLSVIFIFAFH